MRWAVPGELGSIKEHLGERRRNRFSGHQVALSVICGRESEPPTDPMKNSLTVVYDYSHCRDGRAEAQKHTVQVEETAALHRWLSHQQICSRNPENKTETT